LFGDDFSTAEREGFAENEAVNYRVFRPSSGETFEIVATYDPSMENATGNYQTNTLTAILKTELHLTNQAEAVQGSILMYPNPAKEVVFFSNTLAGNEPVLIAIYELHGSLILRENFRKELEINVSAFLSGIYFVTIQTETSTQTRKLIIR